MDQRSHEWHQARVGKITASRFKDVLSRKKPTATQAKAGHPGDPSAERTTYLWQTVIERLTGNPTVVYETAAMRWGTEQEPIARIAYESETGLTVTECGFIPHDGLPVGCSPDGLVGDVGLIEVKCPFNPQNHLMTVLDGMPDDHLAQIQGQLWLTSRQWCDFVSFHPSMPGEFQLYIERIHADAAYHEILEREVRAFDDEAEALIRALRAKVSF